MRNYILLVIAIVLDLIIGDPVTPLHPVRLIGSLISKIENLFYHANLPKRLSGFMSVIVTLTTVIVIYSALYLIAGLLPYGNEVFSVLVFYSTIAIRDLSSHGLRVKKALDKKDLSLARERVGMILSRDTDVLSEGKIIAGTVESISENSSDSIIAPIFWGLFLGPAGALGYRVINTMDAMWGYKNKRYLDFGRTAALLDDGVNYLPARITGIIICFSSLFIAKNPLTAWRIMIRDHKNTASPNAGYPEAAMAGALGIQLGGRASYFKKPVDKPTIGDNGRAPKNNDISKSLLIITISVVLYIVLAGAVVRSLK